MDSEEVREPCGDYNQCIASVMESRGSVFYLYCLKCSRYTHTDRFIPMSEDDRKLTRGDLHLKYLQPREQVR